MIRSLLDQGACPSNSHLAYALGLTPPALNILMQDLEALHGVVLHPHAPEPWVIHPFSLTPTLNWVEGQKHGWWAPCIWCALGVATLAGGDVRIHTRWEAETEPLVIHVRDGQPQNAFSGTCVHFAIPPARAWDNVHRHCSLVLPFRSELDIRDWCARYNQPRGEAVPLLTPADFFVDDPTCGVQALLMSIAAAEQEDLLAVAHRNLDALESQGLNIPLSREVITSLWMRSMSPDRAVGATRPELHLDCTRDKPIDDNTFRDQLQQIRDGCTNIHGGKDLEGRLWFALHELSLIHI